MTTIYDPDEERRAELRLPLADTLFERLELPGLRVKADFGWPHMGWEAGKLEPAWKRRLHVAGEGVRPFAVYFVVEWSGNDGTDVAAAYCERATTRERLATFYERGDESRARTRLPVADALFGRLVLPGHEVVADYGWPDIKLVAGRLGAPWRRRLHVIGDNEGARSFAVDFVIEWAGANGTKAVAAYCERVTTRERLGMLQSP